MSEILVLNGSEVKSLFDLKMAVSAVENAYTEKSSGSGCIWPMIFHEFDPGHADMDIKSGDLSREAIYGLKVVSWFEGNAKIDHPPLYGTVLIFDRHTGAPKALLNGSALTDLRTGAAGAVGVKYLAREDSQTLLMTGCGELAPYLIAASLLVRPNLRKVILVNPHHPEKAAEKLAAIREKAERLLRDCGEAHHAVFEACDNIEAAVRESDIILTATPAREPFIKAEWVKPGTHFSCVGADMAGKQEIDAEILKNAVLIGDDFQQCVTVGECEAAAKQGLISGLTGEIGSVINGDCCGRTDETQITVFDSTGIALQDLSSAAAVIEKAERMNVGTAVEL